MNDSDPVSQAGTLLLIEDDSELNGELVVRLQATGLQVESVTDKQSALDFFNSQPVAIVVMGLELGGENAFPLFEAFKSQKPALPIVLFGSSELSCLIVKALSFEAVDFVAKPLRDLNVLVLVAQKALNNARVAQESSWYRVQLESANRDLSDHLRVLERDQIAGRLVQRKFLPHTPAKLGGIDISFKIFPSLFLSGDSVDYGLLDNRYLAFYLTDVSGHGAGSAFVTVWVKQLVRGLFRERNLFHSEESFENDAPKLMQMINHELIRAQIGRHMTCFVAVIDTETLKMNYVVGGHLPLPLVFEGNDAYYLEGQGKPLGIFEGATWQGYSVQLPEDFRILVFSDGVLETLLGDNLIEREARLKDKLMVTQPSNISAVSTALNIEEKSSSVDDIAMLVVNRNP